MLDTTTKKLNKTDFLSWGILALLFFYMFALNFLMPLHRDDYWYSLVWGTFDKLTTWPDVFHSLYSHYFTHGGRMVAYFVLDSFLLLGKEWFNPFNAFLFVALIVLMYWHSQQKITLRFNPYILLLLIVFTWLGLPHFAEANIWMAGACGYLFTAVLILAFLLPYHFSFLDRELWNNNYLAAIIMLLGGILSGWTIENTATTTTLIAASFTFYFYKKNKLQKWMVSGLCGSVIGLALLIIAPGNYVRYADSKTKLIYHFTNLIAAGVETFFYVLPVILFLVFVWRLLLTDYAKKKGFSVISQQKDNRRFTISSILTIGIIVFMLLSYLNDTFFSKWLGNLLYDNVAVRLGVATVRLKAQLFNTLSGLEEMMIYLLTVTQLFRYAFYKSSLQKKDIKAIPFTISWREILTAYPAYCYVTAWLALAVINHFVMVASPRFPGRAAFGSVIFLIIGAIGTFTVPEVKSYLFDTVRKKYMAIFVGILLLPTALATLYQYTIVYQENTIRMAYVEEMASKGATVLEVAPISIKNRVLRHVYFEDVNNGLSRDFICNYYGLKDIKLKEMQ